MNTGSTQPLLDGTRHLSAVALWLDRLAFMTLLALAASFAFEVVEPLFHIAGLSFTNIRTLLFVSIGLWAVSHLAAGSRPNLPRGFVVASLLWIFALVVATLLAPANRDHAFQFTTRMIQGMLLGWATCDLARTPHRRAVLLGALVGCGIVVAILGLAEVANVPSVVNWLTAFRANQTYVGDVLRLSASLSYATIAAMVLEMIIPVTLALAVTISYKWLRIVLAACLLSAIIALVYTLTRGAILGLLAALGLMAITGLREHRRSIAIGSILSGGAVLAVLGLLLVFNPLLGSRLTNEGQANWYGVTYRVPDQLTARPNALLSVPIRLTNSGQRAWQVNAVHAFRLGYTLARTHDTSFPPLDGLRTSLTGDVAPNQSIEVIAQIAAPAVEGQYLIRWDMVEEDILWFSWLGAPQAMSTLTISGPPVLDAKRLPALPAAHNPDPLELDRPTLWKAALRMFRNRPLLGVGPDNFRLVYGPYLELTHWNTNLHANNLYLEMLADTGLIGLLVFLWLAWTLMRAAVRNLAKQPSLALWAWQLALIAGLTTWFVHGLFDFFYEFTPTYVLFWLMAGLAVSIVSIPAPEH